MAPTLATTATQIASAAATHVVLPLLLKRDGSSDNSTSSADASAPTDECAQTYDDSKWGLRIGGIFIILATSLIGTNMPIILRSSRVIPRAAFDFVKYFGSGVIIATAFMHLLAPAFEELGSPCLTGTWQEYTFAPAFALIACLFMFFAEVAAYRLGTKKLEAIGANYSSHVDDVTDAHSHDHRQPQPQPAGVDNPAHIHPEALAHEEAHEHHPNIHGHGLGHHGPMPDGAPTEKQIYAGDSPIKGNKKDLEANSDASSLSMPPTDHEAAAQIIGVAILEFGVVLHSIIIGLTLSTSDEFTVLFIVIIFHQMFEGLGLGSRLASMQLPRHLNWVRYAAALLYSICTPVGMAAGLGVKQAYNGNSVANLIVSGILDAISAGILLYTGLVELLAHEILLNPRMMRASSGKLAYCFICICVGAGLMALLARWA